MVQYWLGVTPAALDKAIAQYNDIAAHLANEGFFPKAVALYRKILKIKPDEERAMWHIGNISAWKWRSLVGEDAVVRWLLDGAGPAHQPDDFISLFQQQLGQI